MPQLEEDDDEPKGRGGQPKGQGQKGPRAQERAALGNCSLSEAARMLGKPVSWIRILVQRGELRANPDGTLKTTDVEELVIDQAVSPPDPAVEHLKQAFSILTTHMEKMYSRVDESTHKVLELQSRTIAKQQDTIDKFVSRHDESLEMLRQTIIAKAETEVAADDAGSMKETREKFMGLAEFLANEFVSNKMLSGKLRGFMKKVSRSPEKAGKLYELLGEDLGDLSEMAELLEPKGAPDAAAE